MSHCFQFCIKLLWKIFIKFGNTFFRSLYDALKNWHMLFKNDSRFKCILPLEEDKSSDINEISYFTEQIVTAVKILEILVSSKLP